MSKSDVGGGAEKVACDLHQAYRAGGCSAWMAVSYKVTSDPCIIEIDGFDRGLGWRDFWMWVGDISTKLSGRVRGAGRIRDISRLIAEPQSLLEVWKGHENFEFPNTWRLLELPPEPPDIVHCHNLHGGYFDLRALPWLSSLVPVALTLHDAWLLGGHCCHSFECERWREGCGDCPDLTIHNAIRRDATNYNWRWKRDIYAASHLYVATPSRWLMDKVEDSMLTPAVVEAQVIPNGVDLSVFHPDDRVSARRGLGLPQDAQVLLFTAKGIRRNIWKDYPTLREALARAARDKGRRPILFLGLGERAPSERLGQAELRFVPYQEDATAVARFYQAADLYIHAAKADTFPTTVLEALACGTPVVATGVGGIPEQVEEGVTGFLTPPRDPGSMARAIRRLLDDDDLRRRLGVNAAEHARRRFDLNRQVKTYLTWYDKVLASHCRGRNNGYGR